MVSEFRLKRGLSKKMLVAFDSIPVVPRSAKKIKRVRQHICSEFYLPTLSGLAAQRTIASCLFTICWFKVKVCTAWVSATVVPPSANTISGSAKLAKLECTNKGWW